MDIHDASIHISIREDTVRKVCHIFDLAKPVTGNFFIDTVIAFLAA